jgi:c-di-GMP-related signal transduction protein
LEPFALEALIRRDVSLAAKLLPYVNSSLFVWINPVHSVRQALALSGEHEIRNWISLAALPTLSIGQTGPAGPYRACSRPLF